MRRLGPALLLAAAAALGGCKTVKNPAYCDAQSACPSGQTCDLSRNACISMPQPDFAGLDLFGVDLTTCSSSAQCADPTLPICDNGQCRGCASAADCQNNYPLRPFCVAMGRCAECENGGQCKDAAKPTCGSDGTCRPCAAPADCASLVCLPDGTCAAKAIYVDAGAAACPGAGTVVSPFCVLADGVAAASSGGVGVVHVAASAKTYASFTYGGMSSLGLYADPPFSIGQAPNATIVGSMVTPIVQVTAGTVLLDGFEVTGSGASAITCSAAALTVRRSWVHGNVDAGIDTSGCNLTVSRTLIGPNNLGTGLRALDGSYVIEDSMFARNPRLAIELDGTAMGRLRWNSVSGNGASPAPGAISCAVGAQATLEHSIVWGNGADATGAPWFGNCSFADSDVQTQMPLPGNDSLPPQFKDAPNGDLHLVAGMANDACCVDKTLPGNVTGPAPPPDDFDGTPRLKGTLYDRGAHELK